MRYYWILTFVFSGVLVFVGCGGSSPTTTSSTTPAFECADNCSTVTDGGVGDNADGSEDPSSSQDGQSPTKNRTDGGDTSTDEDGCTPNPDCSEKCGSVPDGCGGTYDCGTSNCATYEVCTIGNNTCTCSAPVNEATACREKVEIGVGGCTDSDTCNAGLSTWQYTCSDSQMCYTLTNCGPQSNGCGGTYPCSENDYTSCCPSGNSYFPSGACSQAQPYRYWDKCSNGYIPPASECTHATANGVGFFCCSNHPPA